MNIDDKEEWIGMYGIFALSDSGGSAYWVAKDASVSIKVRCTDRTDAINNLYDKIKEELFKECNK